MLEREVLERKDVQGKDQRWCIFRCACCRGKCACGGRTDGWGRSVPVQGEECMGERGKFARAGKEVVGFSESLECACGGGGERWVRSEPVQTEMRMR